MQPCYCVYVPTVIAHVLVVVGLLGFCVVLPSPPVTVLCGICFRLCICVMAPATRNSHRDNPHVASGTTRIEDPVVGNTEHAAQGAGASNRAAAPDSPLQGTATEMSMPEIRTLLTSDEVADLLRLYPAAKLRVDELLMTARLTSDNSPASRNAVLQILGVTNTSEAGVILRNVA